MPEVTNELIYEVLKNVQDRLGSVDCRLEEMKGEMTAMRLHSLAMQPDIQNIYTILIRHDGRLDRIERRLEITETV
jgi:hypothetical protein